MHRQQGPTCVDECSVDCVHEGARRLYINPAECIDCGACEPACPVGGFYPDQYVFDDMRPFLVDNGELFSVVLPGRDGPISIPQGSREVGPIDADTELTRVWKA